MYWIIVNMGAVGKGKHFLHFDHQLAAEWKRQLMQLPRHFKGNTRLKNILDQVFHYHAQNTGLLDHIRVQHLLADFLLAVISCSQSASVRKIEARLEKIDAYLRTHLDEPVMLPVLAMQAGLSLSRFKNWFKEATGTTPLDYVLRLRIQYAQAALQQGNYPLRLLLMKQGSRMHNIFLLYSKNLLGLRQGSIDNAQLITLVIASISAAATLRYIPVRYPVY